MTNAVCIRVRINAMRALLPKLTELITLGVFFVLAIILLMLIINNPLSPTLIIIIILSTLVIIAIDSISHYLAYSKYHYDFREQHLEVRTAATIIIPYEDIEHIDYAQNFHDRMRGTRTIVLQTKKGVYHLKYIPNDYELYSRIVSTIDNYRQQILKLDVDEKKRTFIQSLFQKSVVHDMGEEFVHRGIKEEAQIGLLLPPHPPGYVVPKPKGPTMTKKHRVKKRKKVVKKVKRQAKKKKRSTSKVKKHQR